MIAGGPSSQKPGAESLQDICHPRLPSLCSHALFPSRGSLIFLLWIWAGTRVSCIAGRFLAIWGTREAPFVTSLAKRVQWQWQSESPKARSWEVWKLPRLQVSCLPDLVMFPSEWAVRRLTTWRGHMESFWLTTQLGSRSTANINCKLHKLEVLVHVGH